MTVTAQHPTSRHGGDPVHYTWPGAHFEIAGEIASSVLVRWLGVVRSVLLTTGSENVRSTLRGLAAWYERMTVDPRFAYPPPGDGIAALIALGREGRPCEPRLTTAFQAVRVAEALGAWRATLVTDASAPERRQTMRDRLELAVRVLSESATADIGPREIYSLR